MDELQLINQIKSEIAYNYLNSKPPLHANDVLSICGVFLFVYGDSVSFFTDSKDISKFGTTYKIFKLLQAFIRAKKRSTLEKYSMQGLMNVFKHEWCPSLNLKTKRDCLNGITIISNIEEEGFVSFRDNDKLYNNLVQRRVVLPDKLFGKDDYILNEMGGLDEKERQDTENIKKENVSLSTLKEWLLETFPLNKYPLGFIKQFPYFWQYKLTQEQYERLKGILLSLNLKDSARLLREEPLGKEFGTVARVVALFVSEWYKRECCSLDGDRCLETIGLKSKHSQQIWGHSGLPEEYLHQNENKNKMRQIAMCSLGGLPLQFAYQSDRFKKFANRLFILKNNEDEITDEDIESIVDSFDDGNRVFKCSLKSGSCKEYLIKLVDYLESGNTEDLPFAESDMGNSPFPDFINRLQEGYDDALSKNFFKTEIRIWTYDFLEEDDESNHIESEFYVQIGSLKSNNVITIRELSKLGIILPPEASMFDARLKIIQKDGTCRVEEEKRTYHKIGNHCNDFCGAFGSSLAVSIDLFETNDIALLIECGDYCKEIPLYTIPSYLELYATNNGFLWTTKTNNAAQKVLFYDKYIYTPQNEEDLDILTKSFEGSEWGWVYLSEAINLVDSTGEVKTIGLGKSELIMVDFNVKSLRNTIELTKNRCVECAIKDEEIKEVPILYFDSNINKRPMLICDGMSGDDLLNNYKVEFKQTGEHTYTEWTGRFVPPQGFISIRITCRDESKKKKQWRRDVYCIPGACPIFKRNLVNNCISIKGENVCVLDESLKNNLTQAKGEFHYKYKDSRNNLELSSIPFRIGDEDNHIILKFYRAFNWTRILNKGKLIKDITNDGSEKPPVALILQKNIHLQVVDEEGYKVFSPCYQRYIDYFRDPRELSFKKQGKNLSGFYIDEESRPYLYCVYISSFDDNGKIRKIEKKKDDKGNEYCILNVSDKEENKKEYTFYYWTGVQQDNPVRLELVRQGERTYRFDIPSPLSNNAVVFQSLHDCSPNLYFRPFYADDNWTWNNYLQRYDLASIDYIIKCYELAVEHNVYFCVFPAIRNLQKRDKFTDFIRQYAQLKNYCFSRKDEGNLTRLAKELSMDWYFSDYRTRYNEDDNQNERMDNCMKPLIYNSPVTIAYKYGRTNPTLSSFNYRREYDGCDNTENRIRLLNQFVACAD